MPLALSFITPLLFSGGGAGTDLVVGAVATDLVAGGGLEAPRADPRRRRLDGLARLDEVLLRGHVTPGQAGLQEAELDAGGETARHLPQGESIHLELEALPGAAVRRLLLGDVARLVVDNHRAPGCVVDAIEAAAHPGGPEDEAELALHLRGLLPRGLLLVIEAGEGEHARALALLLVLAGEEALVPPRLVEGPEEVFERGKVAHHTPLEIELDGLVQRTAVDHVVVLAQRDALDVDVVVLERTGLVVVHLVVTHREELRGRPGVPIHAFGGRGRRVALELLDSARCEGPRGVLGQVERLQDELARLPLLASAHVLRAGEIEA